MIFLIFSFFFKLWWWIVSELTRESSKCTEFSTMLFSSLFENKSLLDVEKKWGKCEFSIFFILWNWCVKIIKLLEALGSALSFLECCFLTLCPLSELSFSFYFLFQSTKHVCIKAWSWRLRFDVWNNFGLCTHSIHCPISPLDMAIVFWKWLLWLCTKL